MDIFGNPEDRDVHGNSTNSNVWGGSSQSDVYGNPPSDIYGNYSPRNDSDSSQGGGLFEAASDLFRSMFGG